MNNNLIKTPSFVKPPNLLEGILESERNGIVVLSPAHGAPMRRILFVNCYAAWKRIKQGMLPPHHLWGCLQLVRMGYEIALGEELPDFYFRRKPVPHDLKFLRFVRDWLKPTDILYSAHNTLFWLPFLKSIGLARCRVVSLIYAREPLNMSRSHDGIIALNPAAAEHARLLAPKAKIAHLGWGMDLAFLPRLPYRPESFLSCGRTQRDHVTLSKAAAKCQALIRLISHGVPPAIKWTPNVNLIEAGAGWETRLSYNELLHDHYARASGSLVIIKADPTEYTACGFTNLLEAMAMSRPVILTRTSALQTEIDIEKAGCGLHVPPEDPDALAAAITQLADNPQQAQAMGETGRRLCETHYNTDRYGADLHAFFESL